MSNASRSGAAFPAPTTSIALLRWPDDAQRRHELGQAGIPRLLLVAPTAPPPLVWDELEDWVREPADPVEVLARESTLLRRAGEPQPRDVSPVLDASGLLHCGDRWVAVPPIEARILARLLERSGQAVPRGVLLDAGWPAGRDDDHILDGRIKLLRRRIAPLGLVIHTVRGHGFLVEQGPTA